MVCFFIIFILLLCGHSLSAETLDTHDYLTQVFSNNEEFIASEEMQKSFAARADEGKLLYSPQLIGHASRGHTESPQLLPYFPIFLNNGDLINREYALGVEQETPLGLKWRLDSTSSFFDFTSSVNATILSFPIGQQTWSVTQRLSIKQPLWKNAFGAKTRAQVREIKYAALARSHQEEFKLKSAASKAEGLYWQLVLARALTHIRAESLEQAEQLSEFIEEKRRASLALESEVYQAKTILNISHLDYEKAKDAESAVAISFNAMRGISASEVCETLLPLSPQLINEMTPKTKGTRVDLKAQEELVKSHEEENKAAVQDLLPELELTASVGRTGNTPHFRSSFDQSIHDPFKSSVVMLKLTLPINVFTIKSVLHAHRRSTNSAKLSLERARFAHEQEWDELNTRLEEQKKMLGLLFENVDLQRHKYENAQEEYARGLSTFFVVTNAFNDYQASKIAVLQTFQTLLEILLKLGLYDEAS